MAEEDDSSTPMEEVGEEQGVRVETMQNFNMVVRHMQELEGTTELAALRKEIAKALQESMTLPRDGKQSVVDMEIDALMKTVEVIRTLGEELESGISKEKMKTLKELLKELPENIANISEMIEKDKGKVNTIL